MAINLNLDRYGAQFDAFVDFASTQRNPGWIACVEGRSQGRGCWGRKNYDELVEAPASRELVALIVPSIEMASNQEIAKDIRSI